MKDPRPNFKKIFLWVTLAHIAVLTLIGLWRCSSPAPEEVAFMEMLPGLELGAAGIISADVGASASGSIPAAPAPAPKGPEAPQPTPPAPPEPAPPAPPVPPTPEVKPSPVVEEETPPPPTPLDKPAPKPEPKPVKPAKPKIKISTEEVVRKSAPSTPSESAANNSSTADKTRSTAPKTNAGGGTGGVGTASAGDISSRLGSAIKGSGVGSSVFIGAVGVSGGGGGSGQGKGFGDYYALIRQVMDQAWDKPLDQGLEALVQITIEKDGRISNVSLIKGSGQTVFDQSVLTAARRVGKMPAPPPEGMNENVTIRFKVQE